MSALADHWRTRTARSVAEQITHVDIDLFLLYTQNASKNSVSTAAALRHAIFAWQRSRQNESTPGVTEWVEKVLTLGLLLLLFGGGSGVAGGSGGGGGAG